MYVACLNIEDHFTSMKPRLKTNSPPPRARAAHLHHCIFQKQHSNIFEEFCGGRLAAPMDATYTLGTASRSIAPHLESFAITAAGAVRG